MWNRPPPNGALSMAEQKTTPSLPLQGLMARGKGTSLGYSNAAGKGSRHVALCGVWSQCYSSCSFTLKTGVMQRKDSEELLCHITSAG